LYRFNELQPAVAGGGAARLQPSLRASTLRTPPRPAPAKPAPEPFRLVVDLGRDIGSRDWWRGAGTCIALCYAATCFWPDMNAVDALPPAGFDGNRWEEAQALAIQPTALGSATGRRMGPTDAVQPLTDAPDRPVMDLRVSLAAQGDLEGALARAGVSQGEAAQVAQMVGAVVPLAELTPGTVLDLKLGRRAKPSDPRPIEKLAFRASFALKIEIARVDGALALTRVPIGVDATPLRLQGTVGTSLYRSARAAGVPAHLVAAYIRVLSTQVGVPAGLAMGDRFDMIVEHRRAATGEVEIGNLLYVGLDRASGADIRMMPSASGGTAQWFEASGIGRETSSGFRMPVQGRMTSPFGYRIHPILGYRRLHTGIDFGAPMGTPIVASAPGQVASAGWDGGYGKAVRLNHGGGVLTLYGHMSRLAVSPGQRVAAGQVLGYVGSTGMSTGPHLHYEVHVNGQRVNPATFRHASRSALEGAELEAFRSRMRALLALPVGAPPPQAVQSVSIPPVRPTAPVARPVSQPLTPRPAPQPAAPPRAAPRPGEW
jgi:murein DD-endopeptidase MepM/ murein hydrolase activator NlpD